MLPVLEDDPSVTLVEDEAPLVEEAELTPLLKNPEPNELLSPLNEGRELDESK